LSGRTLDQKKLLVKELAEATVRSLGVPEDAIKALLTELQPEHWAIGARSMAEIKGGKPGSDTASNASALAEWIATSAAFILG